MSLSKPKRSSFRIDDILSIKTTTSESAENEDEHQDKTEAVKGGDNGITEDITREMQLLSQRFQIQQRNSHSSLLQEIGNRKRRREEIAELAIKQNVNTISQDCRLDLSKHRDLRVSANDVAEMDTGRIYPVTPRATKIPTSLESLMRTHAHDYLLKLPGLNPWTVLTNQCLGVGILPPLLELPSPGRGNKNCICGSITCSGLHRSDTLSYSDGPANFLRPAHSPTSGHSHDAPSIPIPLPVYVRTRDVSSLDMNSKPKKCRRSRTVFSELQLMGLEKKFETQKYLSTPDRLDIADRLGLTQLQVKTWYQNRRMKWKKQVLQGGGTEAPTKPKGRPRKDSLGYGDSTSSIDSPSAQLQDSEDELSDV